MRKLRRALPKDIKRLPKYIRRHIHLLETRTDPAGEVRLIEQLKEELQAQETKIIELKKQIAQLQTKNSVSRKKTKSEITHS